MLLAACSKKADFNYYYYPEEDMAILNQYLNLPEFPDDYTVNFPTSLRTSGLFPRPVERDKAILGRVLFYDKNLSKDGQIACASCHKPEFGFGDNTAVSEGVFDRAGERNSIALASVSNFSAYYGTDLNGPSAILFFWDNRAETAVEQNRGSLTNPKEMDMQMHEVVSAVQAQPYYTPLFKKAYGDGSITETRVTEAIANFVNAMGSYSSKFDAEASSAVTLTHDFSGFSASENRGKSLYMTNCASCHSANMGRPMLLKANNGLDLQSADPGVGGVTNLNADMGLFKVPTLRNIAVSGPYMHDGRFSTLEQVVEHYANGIQDHPYLHPSLKQTNGGFKFTEQQKADLVNFMKTLTDDKVVTEQRYANPFK